MDIKHEDITLEKDDEEYLIKQSNILNGLIRGSINEKARIENLENIQMVLRESFIQAIISGFKTGYMEASVDKFEDKINGIIENKNNQE